MTKNRRRISAAQAARRLAEREHEAPRVTPIPESIRVWLTQGYEPKGVAAKGWTPRVRQLVEASLEVSTARGERTMKNLTSDLAQFWVWLLRTSPDADLEDLTRVRVEDYIQTAMTSSSASSTNDRRSKLLAIADRLHPETAPMRGTAIAHRTVKAPYTGTEMATIRRVAQVQPTAELKRQLCLCVGLGAGAGIDSADLKGMRSRDVVDTSGTIVVNVGGRRPRQSVVLAEFEDLVRIGIAGIAPDELLLGRNPDRHNVVSTVIERASLGPDVPPLAQSRLRTTWLATLMKRPVPLITIMRAAGLSSARTLTEVAQFIEAEVAA